MACPESLIAVGTEHRLADSESLGKMVEAVESVSKPKNPATADETRVPRRFGLGRLLAITITYALMLGVVFLALGTPPVVCAVIAALSMAVGLGEEAPTQREAANGDIGDCGRVFCR